jgi:hypothetical protein
VPGGFPLLSPLGTLKKEISMFEVYMDLLIPGLIKIAKEQGLPYRDFSISDETTKRLHSGDASVYTDIMARYTSGLQRGLRSVEL